MEPTVIKRLAFIKYLFSIAVSQSHLPEPAGLASLLTFHDAVELFNHLACEYLNIDPTPKIRNRPEFLDYWDALSNHLSSAWPQKESMKRMSRARADLKHHGLFPSMLEIESFRAATNSFFADSAPLAFNLEFKDISLIDLVTTPVAKEHLFEASNKLSAGDLQAAIEESAIAFHLLLDDYESRKHEPYGNSPFSFGQDFTFLRSHNLGLGWHPDDEYERRLGDFVDRVVDSLESMQEAIRIMAIGVDYPKYSKFKLFTPNIYFTLDGKYHLNRRTNREMSPTDAQFCIDFVIDTALKLQEFDYTLKTIE